MALVADAHAETVAKLGPLKAVFDADISRTDISNHFGDKKWIVSRGSITCGKRHHLLLKCGNAANTGAPDDPCAVPLSIFSEFESGIFKCLLGSDHCKNGEEIHLSGFLPVQIIIGVESF
jgi:hypothetical protein